MASGKPVTAETQKEKLYPAVAMVGFLLKI